MRALDPALGDPMADPYYRAVRKAEADYELLGELGRDTHGFPAFLARTRDTGELVAIRVEATPGSEGDTAVSLVVARKLDASVPSPASSCPSCGASIEGWSRFCESCGEDVSGSAYGKTAGRRREDLLEAVRRAAEGEYEILGEMDRAEGGGIVYFARELSSGRLVALRLQRDTSESAVPAYTIGVTQVMRVLPWVTGGRGVARAPTDPGSGPRPASHGATGAGHEASGTGPHAAGGPAADAHTTGSGADLESRDGGIAGDTEPSGAGEVEGGGGSTAGFFCPTCGAEYMDGTRFCPQDGTAVRPKAARDDLVGQVLAGRYHVKSRLGEGGMGRVYLAEHVRMGRPCAIKVMHPSLSQDADAVSRFGREAANASRIIHPNVAAIYDFGETSDGLIFLAMEYAEGEPLSRLLKREGPLSSARAAELARQVASALNAAHDLAIVHRDLKPDNIMVSRGRDGREVVKVIDFGIAKTVHGSTQHLTRTGFVVGTPAYMSPEQIAGHAIDGRSDIYSLGCILYEMLAGQAAFAGPSGEVSITRRLTEPPPRVRASNPTVPRALDAIIARAMALAPEDRFRTASELEAALAGPFREESVSGLRRRFRALASGSAWRAITGQNPKSGSGTGGARAVEPPGSSGPMAQPGAATGPTTAPGAEAGGPVSGEVSTPGGVRVTTPPAQPVEAGAGAGAHAASGERPARTGGSTADSGVGTGAAVPGLEPAMSRMPTLSELIPAMPSGSGEAVSGPVAAPAESVSAEAPARRTGGWVWGGVGVAAAMVVIAVFLATGGSDSQPEDSPARAAIGGSAVRGEGPGEPDGAGGPPPSEPPGELETAVGESEDGVADAGGAAANMVTETSQPPPTLRTEPSDPDPVPAPERPATRQQAATPEPRPQRPAQRAEPPQPPPGPTEDELRSVRAALVRGQVATQRGEFRAAREQLTSADELIDALVRRYPGSAELQEIQRQIARAIDLNACETLRAVRIQRGEDPPPCS